MSAASDGIEHTWDGEPISSVPPFGATIVVYRWVNGEAEYLVLHRAHNGRDFAGEWAWGPPSGARYPDEPVAHCAERELFEETGLRLALHDAGDGPREWSVFLAEAQVGAEVCLSQEHDRFAWLPLAQAAACVSPDVVREQLVAAAAIATSVTPEPS